MCKKIIESPLPYPILDVLPKNSSIFPYEIISGLWNKSPEDFQKLLFAESRNSNEGCVIANQTFHFNTM